MPNDMNPSTYTDDQLLRMLASERVKVMGQLINAKHELRALVSTIESLETKLDNITRSEEHLISKRRMP